MKKIFIVLLIVMFTSSVFALENVVSLKKYVFDNDVIENIDVVLKKDEITDINIVYTIPNEYDKGVINIKSNLDKVIADLNDKIINKINVSIAIKNDSFFDYEYRDYSFIFLSENNSNFERPINQAIKDLYSNKNITKDMLEDEMLSLKLKENGYSGIEELDLFFLEYYNLVYNTAFKKLDDFDDERLFEIFSGKTIEVEETNLGLKELVDNRFSNNLNLIKFYNGNLYSHLEYMNNKEMVNPYFKEYFGFIKSDNVFELDEIDLILSNNNISFELKLDKVQNDIDFDINEVVPPKTGI